MKPRFLLSFLLILIALISCGPDQERVPAIPELDPSPTTQSELAGLEDLEIEAFFEESFNLLLLRDPDWVTQLGLQERMGAPTKVLTDMSEAYLLKTRELERDILAMLITYDRESLPKDQRISYDTYVWYLDDRVRQSTYAQHDYNVSQFGTDDPNGLIYFFTDIHPIRDKGDAEDYVARLSHVGERLSQQKEGLELREDSGVVLPGFIIDLVIRDLGRVVHAQAGSTPFFTTFDERLDAVNGLSVDEREELLEAAEEAIATIVQPAFVDLLECLKAQKTRASDDAGAWKLPDGDAYYAQTLRHHTTSDLSTEEIHDLGIREVDRLHAEIRDLAVVLGVGKDADLSVIFQAAARQGGGIPREQVLSRYDEIITDMQARLPEVFDHLPDTEIIVLPSPSGNFYEPASMDGARPAAFHASFGAGQDYYRMPSLTYHETIPGHHLQIATAQMGELPLFRNVVGFTGFAEGWALYAERLAWEMGLYDDDPYGDLGRLQYELLRAARLVIDTGLHAKGWSFDEAVSYMVENTVFSLGTAQYEVARYVVWPGQATAYYVGMLKILELRDYTADELGEAFDLKEFHSIVLKNGSVPLEILEQVVEAYTVSKK